MLLGARVCDLRPMKTTLSSFGFQSIIRDFLELDFREIWLLLGKEITVTSLPGQQA